MKLSSQAQKKGKGFKDAPYKGNEWLQTLHFKHEMTTHKCCILGQLVLKLKMELLSIKKMFLIK